MFLFRDLGNVSPATLLVCQYVVLLSAEVLAHS